MKRGKSEGISVDHSDNIYKAIFENSIDAIFITTPDGGIQSANPAACKLFNRTEQEIIEIGLNELIDQSDQRIAFIVSERAGTGSFKGEVNHKSKDGTLFLTEMSTSLFIDHDGKERSIINIRDLTDIVLKDKILEESESKFRMLVNLSPAGIYMTDDDGKCTFVNKAWCMMAGMEPDEAYGDGWINAIHPADRAYVSGMWDKYVNSGREWNWNYRFVDKQGVVSWVFGVSKPILDASGNTIGFIGTNTDITDVKLAEENLKHSEEKYRLLSEQSGVGVGLYSKDGIILYYNSRALKNLGGKSEDFIGKPLQDVFGKKEGNKYLKRVKEAIRLRKNMVYEDQFTSPTGNYWFASNHSLFCNSDGKVIGVQVVSHDITERKLIESQLIHTTTELRELTRHLVEVREEERTTIARDLHDDLGQKLTALNMDISWLKARIGVQSRTVENKIMQMIQMMNNTIESVQKISFGLRPSILDDLGLIPAIEWQLTDFHRTSGISCNYSCSPNNITVDAGISLVVFRIIQEALTNIARHSGATKAGVKISLTKGILEILIKDNGSGITQEKIDSSRSYGLIGMRERVILVSGELSITGTHGKGTSVYVRIPVGEGSRQ